MIVVVAFLWIKRHHTVDHLLEIGQYRILEVLVGIKVQDQHSGWEAEKDRSLEDLFGLILGPGPVDD